MAGGVMNVSGDLMIAGGLTHDPTRLTSEAVQLVVGGKVTVTKTGAINVDEKSDGKSGALFASHGGLAGSSTSSLTSAAFGSIIDPADLGQRSDYRESTSSS